MPKRRARPHPRRPRGRQTGLLLPRVALTEVPGVRRILYPPGWIVRRPNVTFMGVLALLLALAAIVVAIYLVSGLLGMLGLMTSSNRL